MDHVLGPHSDCVSELAGGGAICYLFFFICEIAVVAEFYSPPARGSKERIRNIPL